jgi:hypothetical protein
MEIAVYPDAPVHIGVITDPAGTVEPDVPLVVDVVVPPSAAVSVEISGGVGPQGPQGVVGPQGPPGPAGVQGPPGTGSVAGMVAGQIPIAAGATAIGSSANLSGDVTSAPATLVTTLATVNSNIGTFARATVTVDGKGRVTAASAGAADAGITQLTGDGIAGPGNGSQALTLANVNANVGTWNNVTVNGKGLVTAGSNVAYLTSSGISGMVAGQIPIAASATTITSSGNLSGAVTTSGSLATTLAANAVATTNITNANVTYAKIQNVTAARLLGNPTGSAAAPSEISLANGLSFITTVLNGPMSGMTSGQIPIAAGASTVTSSANLSGDITSNATLVTTLATVNSNVGTWNNITINAKGLATAGSNVAYLTTSGVSGMTAGQIAIAATATTITSSIPTSTFATPASVTTGDNLRVLKAGDTMTGTLAFAGTAATTSAAITVGGTTTAAVYSQWTNTSGNLLTGIESSTGGTVSAGSSPYATIFGSQNATSVQFLTNNTVRATLDSAGNFGIGTPSGNKFSVVGPSTAGTTLSMFATGPAGADSTSVHVAFFDGGRTTVNGSISRTGTNAVLYNTTSDARLKTDITDSDRGLDALLAIKVSDYRMGKTHQQGLLAQDVYKVYPEAVRKGGADPDLDPWMIDYGRLTPLLIRGMQQQQAQIASLTRRLAALERPDP